MIQTLDAPVMVESGPRLLTIDEYERLPDDLFPEGERVELVEGLLYRKMGHNDPHITALYAVFEALQEAYGQGHSLGMQVPLKLGDTSKPEPDVTVRRGSWRDYDGRRPNPLTDVPLVVEVAETSLANDRGFKARLYAQHGIPEYWVVNLRDRALEVYRKPEQGAYTEIVILHEGKSVEVGSVTIKVTNLLPKVA